MGTGVPFSPEQWNKIKRLVGFGLPLPAVAIACHVSQSSVAKARREVNKENDTSLTFVLTREERLQTARNLLSGGIPGFRVAPLLELSLEDIYAVLKKYKIVVPAVSVGLNAPAATSRSEMTRDQLEQVKKLLCEGLNTRRVVAETQVSLEAVYWVRSKLFLKNTKGAPPLSPSLPLPLSPTLPLSLPPPLPLSPTSSRSPSLHQVLPPLAAKMDNSKLPLLAPKRPGSAAYRRRALTANGKKRKRREQTLSEEKKIAIRRLLDTGKTMAQVATAAGVSVS
ncbi:hypothetical protein BC940DRAFT_297565 [Gongronella butleri]|nr:hypothetical protein BC940DRAFT_297565 [Gongronella butleri]